MKNTSSKPSTRSSTPAAKISRWRRFAEALPGQVILAGEYRLGNGAFTKALVEGVSGKADYGGKVTISINMLDLYLSERMKELTGGKQMPTTTKPNTVPDFPVAMKR